MGRKRGSENILAKIRASDVAQAANITPETVRRHIRQGKLTPADCLSLANYILWARLNGRITGKM